MTDLNKQCNKIFKEQQDELRKIEEEYIAKRKRLDRNFRIYGIVVGVITVAYLIYIFCF